MLHPLGGPSVQEKAFINRSEFSKELPSWLGAGVLALLGEAEEAEFAQLVQKSQFQETLETTERTEAGSLLGCTVGI